MIKTVLIDDEPGAIRTLSLILKEFCPDVEIVATASNAAEGIGVIRKNNPDLVFLDIEMPNGSGFDVLEAIPLRDFSVVFVTAYNHYALKAIKFSAADYILKPVEIEEVVNTVKKIKDRTKNFPDLENLLSLIKRDSPGKISIPTTHGTEYISTDDILYLEADRSYCTIHLNDGKKMVVSRSLSDIEAMLPADSFARIHKSYLINLASVRKHLRNDGGYVELMNGTKLSIARNKKDEFAIIMARYISR